MLRELSYPAGALAGTPGAGQPPDAAAAAGQICQLNGPWLPVTAVFGEFLGAGRASTSAEAVSSRAELSLQRACGFVLQLYRPWSRRLAARYPPRRPAPPAALDPSREPKRVPPDAIRARQAGPWTLAREKKNWAPPRRSQATAQRHDSPGRRAPVGPRTPGRQALPCCAHPLRLRPLPPADAMSLRAPVITLRGPVTVGPGSRAGGLHQSLASGSAKLPGRRVSPGGAPSRDLAWLHGPAMLRLAAPPSRARATLALSILLHRAQLSTHPGHAQPLHPRLSVNAAEPVAELVRTYIPRSPPNCCATRTTGLCRPALWSPAAPSCHGVRDALASAIATTSSELILRTARRTPRRKSDGAPPSEPCCAPPPAHDPRALTSWRCRQPAVVHRDHRLIPRLRG